MDDLQTFRWPDAWTGAIPVLVRRVRAVCRPFGVQASDADDLTQCVLYKVHRATFLPRPGEDRLRNFNSVEELAAWAGVVARNLLAERSEAVERQKVDPGVNPEAVAGSSVSDPDLEPLAQYLELLTDPVEREVLRLRFEGDGLTLEAIAARLGRSLANVHKVLHAAIKKLRRSFGE